MSKKMSRFPSERKVYVGDLGNSARKNDIEYAFAEYGPICSVWIARNPPGFAFVEYEDARDAADAVRELDGRNLCGRRVRVELSTDSSKGKSMNRRNDRNHRGGRNDESTEEKCYDCGVRGHFARECRRYVRARRRNEHNDGGGNRTPSDARGSRRTPSPATRSRSRSHSSRHRNSPTSSSHRRQRPTQHERRSRDHDVRRSRENGDRHSDEDRHKEYRSSRAARRPPSPDAKRHREYDSASPRPSSSSGGGTGGGGVGGAADSRKIRHSSSSGSDRSSRGRDDSSVSYSRSSSRKD